MRDGQPSERSCALSLFLWSGAWQIINLNEYELRV